MSEYHDTETGEVMPPNPSQALDVKLLHGELLCSPDTTEVWGALIQAQGEMAPPQRTKTAKVKGRTKAGIEYEYEYTYAPLEEIIAKLRPAFAKYGLGYQQFLARVGNNPVLRTIIIHKSAQWTAIDYPIFWDTSKGQQGFQGGVTYARRGGLSLATGLAPEDDDDANVLDGQQATISNKEPAMIIKQDRPATKGATRTARPTPAATPPAMIDPFAGNGASPGPSSTGRPPEWVAKFFTRDSYEIDPKAAGGWSSWEKFYCTVANAADNFDQLTKLDEDNKNHCVEFSGAVRDVVYNRFREVLSANAKRLVPSDRLVEEPERVFEN
jgi:hypothetical protein